MEFEWNEAKATSNERKHGVSFVFATGVFLDEQRTERLDEVGSPGEERWATTGLIEGLEVLVIYTVRAGTIRLISARRASRNEREEYWNG